MGEKEPQPDELTGTVPAQERLERLEAAYTRLSRENAELQKDPARLDALQQIILDGKLTGVLYTERSEDSPMSLRQAIDLRTAQQQPKPQNCPEKEQR